VKVDRKGIGTGAIVAIVVVVVVVVVVVAVLAVYFLGSLGSKVEMTFTPSTLHVGDSCTATITVTNKESGTMTISGATMKTYRNDQLVDTSTSTTGWENSIPPGQTVTIFSGSSTVASTIHYGGTSYSSVGTWRFEVSLNTNYGALQTTCTCTVLA
jgi:hypothetical protein